MDSASDAGCSDRGAVLESRRPNSQSATGGAIQKTAMIRRSESLKVRRHGRIGVPMITVQGADDMKSEVRFVSSFTKSDSLDTGLEKQRHSDLEFNIVVSPKKLVSLGKSHFVCTPKRRDMSMEKGQNGILDSNHKTETETDSGGHRINGIRTPMVSSCGSETKNSRQDVQPERRVSGHRTRKTSSQLGGPTRRLSPAPYHIPGAAEKKQSLTSLMDSGKKRRDSVAAMPTGKSLNPVTTKHRRVSLAPTPTIPKRRSSVKDTLTSYVATTGSDNIHARRTREYLYKNGLPFDEDVKTAKIEKGKIDITIPIYNVTQNDTKVCITDLKAIEAAIHVNHPEVTVLKPEEKNGMPDSHPHLSVSDNCDKMHEKMSGKNLAVIAEGDPGRTQVNATAREKTATDRKLSIRSCVKRMREDRDNYTNQLIGCKNLGTYASMETLHVLLSKQDAIRCVLDAMDKFQDKEELQFNACASLLEMASASEANCYIIQQNQGIPALLNCMKCYSEKVPLMRLLLNIFAYLSTSEDLSHELLQYGCHSRVLGAMSQHGEDNSIVKQCLFILGNLVTTEETAHQIMLVGGVHTVIDMMDKFPDDPDVMENGCRALGSFAAFDNTCLDVGQAGATKSVLAAMATFPANVCVLECGCWALACLTTMADTCEELDEQDGVEVVLASLEAHQQEESLQEYGVRTICNLASLDTTMQTVTTEQVMTILQRMMIEFPDSVEMQGQVIFALSQIARAGEDMQECILKRVGVRSVVTTLKLHPEDIAIQEHGCRLLGNMAVNGKLRRQTEEEGASSAVISAMLTLDTSEEIQECGCLALMNITADFKDNKIRVKNNGGVLALLTCLNNFRSSPNIVLSSLKTLGNIIELDEVCRLVMDERGLGTIVDVAKSNSDYPDVQVFAALVLCGLSGLKNLSTDGIEMIDKTMTRMLRLPSLNADLALFVCMTLENILNTDVGMHMFIAEKRLDVILTTMQKFSYQPEILQCCCKMIAILALDTRHEMTSDAVRVILTSMKSFTDKKDLQIVGCGALSCLSENNASLMTSAIEANGVSIISAALSHHPEEERLHAVALMALTNISQSDAALHADQIHVIHDHVHAAMTRFSEILEIQIYACNAIAACRPTVGKKTGDFLEALKYALRRHGKKDTLHRPLAKALRSFWQADHKTVITKILETSPTLQIVFTAELQEAEAPVE